MSFADQLDMEEWIAAYLFDHSDVTISEETANQLSGEILLHVLQKFRPELTEYATS